MIVFMMYTLCAVEHARNNNLFTKYCCSLRRNELKANENKNNLCQSFYMYMSILESQNYPPVDRKINV